MELAAGSLDAVFTDPPYFGNVQYGELMDFCYAWLRRLVGSEAEGFDRPSTRSADELTGNATQARGLVHFTEGLSAVYCSVARALKPDAPLAFTFHHNKIEAYYAVGVAILDADSLHATLPCPAEMGGSIHIHGTGSSIIDTVFVCRARRAPARRAAGSSTDGSSDELAQLARRRRETNRRRYSLYRVRASGATGYRRSREAVGSDPADRGADRTRCRCNRWTRRQPGDDRSASPRDRCARTKARSAGRGSRCRFRLKFAFAEVRANLDAVRR